MKQLVVFTFALCLLSACGPSQANRMMAERMDRLHSAQTIWNECQVDSNCTGDEMAKARFNLQDSQGDVDRLNAIEANYRAQVSDIINSTNATIQANSRAMEQPWNPGPAFYQMPSYVPSSGITYLPQHMAY
jgi:hypothetical protein